MQVAKKQIGKLYKQFDCDDSQINNKTEDRLGPHAETRVLTTNQKNMIAYYVVDIFVRMFQGLVEGLIGVSMSLTMLYSRIDFFFFIICPPGI